MTDPDSPINRTLQLRNACIRYLLDHSSFPDDFIDDGHDYQRAAADTLLHCTLALIDADNIATRTTNCIALWAELDQPESTQDLPDFDWESNERLNDFLTLDFDYRTY